jgi:bifunctional non-homologous end joining protein LigD
VSSTPVPPGPMLATAATLPTNSAGYCFEAKWDGVRALARCDQRAELFSRNANNLTPCFPEVTRSLSEALAGRSAILDGELVALDKRARPSFALVQRRLRATRPPGHLIATVPAMYFIFDVLYLDGADVTRRPYVQRRDLLASLQLDNPPVITPPYWTNITAEAMFDVVRDMGLEGLVIKRATSSYQPGRRSAAWIKSVVRRRCPMVVGGFVAGAGRHTGAVGTLLVGAHNDAGELVYCGHVGSGLTDRMRDALAHQLAELRCAASPFTGPTLASDGGRVGWVTPTLVVNIEYRQFTGRLRHPSLKGLADVDPDLVRLPPNT